MAFDLSSTTECRVFENLFKDAVEALRTALADHDIRHIDFTMNADGRTCSGDCKINFTLSTGYGEQRVSSHSLKPILPEVLRRYGFDQANRPLMISGPDKATEEDDY